jgi:MFS family permease
MSLKKDNLNFHTTRRFAPLFGTQFLGALNDNMFKTALFVMISFYGLGKNDFLPPSQMLNLGAMLFILPYFLFSALSGQLSNKFDKAVLARWIKLLEIIIMAVAAYGFYIQSAPLLLICLLHGYAIDLVRPPEICHFARLPQRQRADYGQQPD